MGSPLRPRASGLPGELRQALARARQARGWSQGELGRQIGLPQMHISAIETGKVVPRFDTLQELVRALGHDLLLVPRTLVPVVQALTANETHAEAHEVDERPLYLPDEEEARA